MSDESKYYYIRPVDIEHGSRRQILEYNKFYFVQIDEDFELRQYISLNISKYGEDIIGDTKDVEYETVRNIEEDVFIDYFATVLKFINNVKISDGDFYILKNRWKWFQVEYYSKDLKNKRNIVIDFRDGIDALSLSIQSSGNYKYRPAARKNGVPITSEEFKEFLNMTLSFLSNREQYKVSTDTFVKKIRALAG